MLLGLGFRNQHARLRTFHRKSTCPEAIQFKSFLVSSCLRYPTPDFGLNEGFGVHRFVGLPLALELKAGLSVLGCYSVRFRVLK